MENGFIEVFASSVATTPADWQLLFVGALAAFIVQLARLNSLEVTLSPRRQIATSTLGGFGGFVSAGLVVGFTSSPPVAAVIAAVIGGYFGAETWLFYRKIVEKRSGVNLGSTSGAEGEEKHV